MWKFLAELFLKVIAPFLAFYAGRESEKKDFLEKELESEKENTAAWANRPRTDADALDRLLRASERAEKP